MDELYKLNNDKITYWLDDIDMFASEREILGKAERVRILERINYPE